MRRLLAAPLCVVLVWFAHLPAHAQATTVTIGRELRPDHLEVAAGTTVTWRNVDDERHRVRSVSGPERMDSGNLAPGETWTFTFSTAGTFHYLDARDDDNASYHGIVTVTAGTPSGGPPSDGSSGERGGGDTEVSLVDRSFSPATIEVPTGTTVRWTNTSDRDHNVTAADGSFASGELGGGGTFDHTFREVGAFDYFCTLHGGMRGTVLVGGGNPTRVPATSEPAERSASSQSRGARSEGSSGLDQTSDPGPDAQTLTVEAQDFAFEPESLTLPAGDTVEWTNVGEAPHTVTAQDGSFESEIVDSGGTFRHRFDESGVYDYVCRFHPEMVGRVEVVDGDGEASADASGEVVTPNAPVVPSESRPDGNPSEDSGREDAEAVAPDGVAQTAAADTGTDDTGLPLALLLVLGAIAVAVPASVLIGATRIARALRSTPGR